MQGARTSGVRAGLGASSTSFWLRRWMEQSRSPRCTTLPCLSAITCTHVQFFFPFLLLVLFAATAVQPQARLEAAAWCGDRGGACLELDVAGVDNVALDVARAVAERRLRLLLRGAQQLEKVLLALREPHAAPPTARRRLDHQREADVVRYLHTRSAPSCTASCPHSSRSRARQR